MMLEVKRLVFSGLISIMITCLIVTEVTVMPWSEQPCEAGNHEPLALYYTWPPPGMFSNEPKVNLSVLEFTEPSGIGSEAEIRVTVTSRYDAHYVTVRIDLLKMPSFLYPNATSCIEFIDENKSRKWLVDLEANVSRVFTERIKAVDVGFGAIRASAAWWGTWGSDHLGQDGLLVSVSEEKIGVTRETPSWCPSMDAYMKIECGYNIPLLVSNKFNVTTTTIFPADIQNITDFTLESGPISEQHPPFKPFEIPMRLLIPRAPLPPQPRLSVKLRISEFEPLGLGGEANLTLTVTSNYDASNVTALIDLVGFELIIGDLTWSGELEANVSESFSVTVRASRVGCWNTKAYARWYVSPIQFYNGYCKLGIHVSNDEISTVEDGFPEYHHVTIPGSCIYLEPAIIDWTTDSHDINETFTIEVRVTNVTDISAIQFYVKWNPTVLRILSIQKGDFLETSEHTSIWAKSERETDLGYILAGHCLLGKVSGIDIRAPNSGLVATLTFQVVNFTDSAEICFVDDSNRFQNYWFSANNEISYDFEFMFPSNFLFKN